MKITTKIKLWGIVQGVGFRPFVAKLADRYKMQGEVLNIGGLVDIIVTDTPDRIEAFIEAIRQEKPAPAEIIHIKKESLPFREFMGFQIIESAACDDEAAMIPADLSICPNCIKELADEKNPRYRHPFISCMECGPRFTIIDLIPYDRDNTSMIDFSMCDFCEKEYKDKENRRYHAQTISCHDCGPMLIYRDEKKAIVERSSDELIALAAKLISEGKVIALKGAGGYNLICDPFAQSAVCDLRKVKGREEKPFAVMFRDIEQVVQYCHVSEVEEKLLLSSAKPILLLERKEQTLLVLAERGQVEPAQAPPAEFEKSRFIGSFLPSMGLHHLLLESCGKPLIVTSANVSGLPMIKDDLAMFDLADRSNGLIAGVFFNRRNIRVSVDDSVVRVIDGQPQMIRRSKGYAPVPLLLGINGVNLRGGQTLGSDVMMLACGGQLKSSFALSKGSFSYVSQYFGDLDSLESCRIYEENVDRMKAFFSIEPRRVLCDLHPLYETTKYAQRYVKQVGLKFGAELLKVQHHHAHVASVMAEHHLFGPVIGVSFDGTGYGTDGKIWGGEFLICEGSRFRRFSHLKYIRMLGGDSSMKEAWKSAMSYAFAEEQGIFASEQGAFGETEGNGEMSDEIVVDLSDILEYRDIRKDDRWSIVKEALRQKINTVESSSMGRLFDAVSALLMIKQENDYEGQCAILLEDAAARAQKYPGKSRADDLALAFHHRICDMILTQCRRIRKQENIEAVALTGGVFQNKILMERSLKLLREEGFHVYYNISVSPNDGGIALGQNYIGMCDYLERKEKTCVLQYPAG